MPRTQRVTFSFRVTPGEPDNDRIIAYLNQSHINASEVARLGILMYIDSLEGRQVVKLPPSKETERKEPPASNPFLAASP